MSYRKDYVMEIKITARTYSKRRDHVNKVKEVHTESKFPWVKKGTAKDRMVDPRPATARRLLRKTRGSLLLVGGGIPQEKNG